MLALLAVPLVAGSGLGCGGKVFVEEGTPSSSAGTGGSMTVTSSTGVGGAPTPPIQQAIERVTAPDETHVVVELAAPLDDDWLDPARYSIGGVYASVEVMALEEGTDGSSVVLETSKQPLGLSLTLDKDEHSGSFLSADTAQFWVVDWTTPNFAQVQKTAARREVGNHVVIYVQEGLSMANAAEIRSYFDDTVFPNTTSLFAPAPDRDQNQRIVLLGIDGQDVIGGYFSSVDPLPDDEAFPETGFHSNEKEMLYLNTVYGEVNAPHSVVPHEFSHLLYRELHPDDQSWSYHNEGLAECVVRTINGFYFEPVYVYETDPLGDLANGKSLIDWEFANYSQYAQAYIFWSYVAGQLDGIDTYVELMKTDGSPESIEAYLQQRLGKGIAATMHSMMVASWAQHPSGEHGFNGFIQWQSKPAMATASNPFLPSLAGAFVAPTGTSVHVPPGQGPNIAMVGIDGSDNVDLSPPFSVGGGVVVALNHNPTSDSPSEPIGLASPITFAPEAEQSAGDHLTWLHPPPFDPRELPRLKAWRKATRNR